MDPQLPTLALLIDAENTELPKIERVLAEAGRHGIIQMRRAYGDWDSYHMRTWKECLASHGIETIRQPEPVCVKNSADRALQEDARAMLREREVDGFCIVASDSGYGDLVKEARRQGTFVIGIGAGDKSPSYSEECNAFIHMERLPPVVKPDTMSYDEADLRLIDGINRAIRLSAKADDGWVFLTEVKNHLPDLDPHAYCHKGMLSLVQTYTREFEIRRDGEDGSAATYQIRSKRTP